MGKKNIKPSINQPVIRTHVAKPALEGLTEENLTFATNQACGDIAPANIFEGAPCQYCCSYDGDDAE